MSYLRTLGLCIIWGKAAENRNKIYDVEHGIEVFPKRLVSPYFSVFLNMSLGLLTRASLLGDITNLGSCPYCLSHQEWHYHWTFIDLENLASSGEWRILRWDQRSTWVWGKCSHFYWPDLMRGRSGVQNSKVRLHSSSCLKPYPVCWNPLVFVLDLQ